jgi:glutamyl-tRNA reductase
VELAGKILGSLHGRRVLLLGSGEMSRLAAECLLKEGVSAPVIVSRTRAHALRLAQEVGGSAAGFEDMPRCLREAELVVTATAAPHAMVTRALIQDALAARHGRQLCLIDIALPRDVEPEVGALPGVFLFDLDDLRRVVETNLERRRSQWPVAEQLIERARTEYEQWLDSLDAVPTIRAIRGNAEAVRQRETRKVLKRLSHLPPEEQQRIEQMTQQLVNKVLHSPTVRLRQAATAADGVKVLEAARILFEG